MLAEAMAGLSAADRSLLRLRLVEELSHDQIAEALGITAELVRKQFSRARQRLAAGVSAADHDFRAGGRLHDASPQTNCSALVAASLKLFCAKLVTFVSVDRQEV